MHRDEIPPGTLYLLILKTLARSGVLQGNEIAESISAHLQRGAAGGRRFVISGAAANAHQGLGDSEMGTTAGNRLARYYQLTAAGRKQLAVELSQFERVIGAAARVIEAV